jgi:hypothetical protein
LRFRREIARLAGSRNMGGMMRKQRESLANGNALYGHIRSAHAGAVVSDCRACQELTRRFKECQANTRTQEGLTLS